MPPELAPTLRKGLAAGAMAGAAALSLRALVKPLPAGDHRLLDWEEVRRIAHSRTGEGTAPPPDRTGAIAEGYDGMATEMAPLMAEVVGPSALGFPPFTVLDRRGFVDRNLDIVQRLLGPVETLRAQIPDSRVTAAGRGVLSRYMGELFGFLSSRVLGQYDPVLMLAPSATGEEDPSALYLVEPNVQRFEERGDVDGTTLRRWLVLHEVTHAWQFEAHPWLREHLAAVMNELLMNELTQGLLQGDQPAGRAPRLSFDVLRDLPLTVRSQLRGAQRIQAVMSVCEGYSNFVMHRVGRAHLEDFDRLEEAFHRRSADRTTIERLVLAVTGMSMKMRQYELGERFADAVVDIGGLELLNRVWDGPELMPSMRELEQPRAWARRVG